MGLNLWYEKVYISNRLYEKWKKMHCFAEGILFQDTKICIFQKENSIDLTASGLLHLAKKIGDK